MKRIALFTLIFLAAQPLKAAEVGDCHAAIETAFPDKIVGISGSKGNIQRIDFKDGVSDQDKAQIQSFVQSFDWSVKNNRDLDKEIDQELRKIADDKSLSDAEFEAKRVKLVRAKEMSQTEDKKTKLGEAKTPKAKP